MIGNRCGGMKGPKSLLARRVSPTSCLMDLWGGHRLSQSLSTSDLKLSQDSCEHRIVEDSQCLEVDNEAHDRTELLIPLVASSSACAEICVSIAIGYPSVESSEALKSS